MIPMGPFQLGIFYNSIIPPAAVSCLPFEARGKSPKPRFLRFSSPPLPRSCTALVHHVGHAGFSLVHRSEPAVTLTWPGASCY